jgi:hypothetical protein
MDPQRLASALAALDVVLDRTTHAAVCGLYDNPPGDACTCGLNTARVEVEMLAHELDASLTPPPAPTLEALREEWVGTVLKDAGLTDGCLRDMPDGALVCIDGGELLHAQDWLKRDHLWTQQAGTKLSSSTALLAMARRNSATIRVMAVLDPPPPFQGILGHG